MPDFADAALPLPGSGFCAIYCRIVQCYRLDHGPKLVMGYQTRRFPQLLQLFRTHLFFDDIWTLNMRYAW